MRKWITGEGFGDAGLRPNLRHWPLYLLALLWPSAASILRVLLAVALHTAPAGFTIPWGIAAPSPLSLLIWTLGAIALAPIIFGEEFGWRLRAGATAVRQLPARGPGDWRHLGHLARPVIS